MIGNCILIMLATHSHTNLLQVQVRPSGVFMSYSVIGQNTEIQSSQYSRYWASFTRTHVTATTPRQTPGIWVNSLAEHK